MDDAKVIIGPWSPLPETPNLPAVPEPLEGEIVLNTTLSVAPTDQPKPKRRPKPEWLGWSPRHRAALRSALWYRTCQCTGRTWFEIREGIWVRLWHLLRWFGRGLICFVVLARWIFAVDERADLRKPGIPPGRAALIGAKVDLSWKLRGGFVLVANVGFWLAVWHWVPPGEVPWPALFAEHLFVLTSAKVAWIAWGVPWVVAVTIYGVLHDEKPPAPVVAPRAREDVTVTAMNNALRAVGILAQPTAGNAYPESVRLAGTDTVGIGKETAWDLPDSCGKSNLDVIALRDRLAAAFATPRDQFHIEKGRHEAQFIVWQSRRDPFAGKAPEHPLLAVDRWNVWDPVPFAVDVRGRTVTHSLIYVSDLTGSRPRRGKSKAVQSKLVGAVLDPTVKFHVFDGKGGGTWAPLKPFADTFLAGSDDDDVKAVMVALERLVAEMRARAKRIPGSKLTREVAADPSYDAPITVIIVDEAQEYLTYPVKEWRERIKQALFTLGKVGPSTGGVIELITQRPDDESLPTSLRSAFGSRFALAVMAYHDSNVILGPDQSKAGHDASKITRRGVGIYRPDDNADGEPDEDPNTTRLVRVFDMSDEVWEAVCQRGAELREKNPASEAIEAGPKPEDDLLDPTELFVRIGNVAPEIFADHGIKDVRTFGRWLTVPYTAIRTGGVRVRSRLAVEIALGLHPGALRIAPVADPCSDGADPVQDPSNEQCSAEHTTTEDGSC